jgi:hypothetical protein
MLDNPLTMQGTLRHCWLFTYREAEASVRSLVPPELRLVARGGFAFWNVVCCRVEALRPAPLPAWVGLDYWHVAYRLYVETQTDEGPVQGLYFLRSDCDRALIAAAGNLLTRYRFHHAAIEVAVEEGAVEIRIDPPGARARVTVARRTAPALAQGSPFSTLEEAGRELKYQPFGLSVPRRGAVNVVAIQRDENAWVSTLRHVEHAEWDFFKERDVAPEVCYDVMPIRYRWHRGRPLRVTARRK